MDLFNDDFDSPDTPGARAFDSAEIFAIWREHAYRELPWCAMPADDRTGVIRPVILALLDLSNGLYGAARRRKISLAASRHGAFRRAQGCDEPVLADDFTLVRLALKTALARFGVSNAVARPFIRNLLPDLRLARRVALETYKTGMIGGRRGGDSRFE
jgi:hypothetical protein